MWCAPIKNADVSPRSLIPVLTITWDYAYLIEVHVQGDTATLTCGTEADFPEFEVTCDALDALAPYLEIHSAWRAFPAGVEPPLIPYVQERTGRSTFSTEGAGYDNGYAVSA
jgi:hypothetical protein